jgi:KipI family sensor histidine kinase inhibitor
MSRPTRARAYGESAVLVDVPKGGSPVALARVLDGVDGIVEAVPGARTVLIEFDPQRLARPAVLDLLTGEPPPDDSTVRLVTLPVHYDGADLATVAHLAAMSPDEVVRRHAAAEYTVAFCGFTPGFAYLTGLDRALHVGRLDEPRTTVPAGSVGIAGEFTGVYPRRSPGGWRLLGTTSAALWDVDRDPPALLSPGTRVRFVPQ